MLWKPIPDWPYEASAEGGIRNARTCREICLRLHKSGYLDCQLWNRGRYRTRFVATLVALAFHGEPPSPEHEVAHRDGNRINNRPTNLFWGLHGEVMRKRDIHGTTARGRRNGKLKHADERVSLVRALALTGLGYRRIARTTGIPLATVRQYVLGRRRQVATRRPPQREAI